MLLDPNTRILYIFAGQRDGTFLSDMYAFNLKTNSASEIFSDSAAMGGPGPSFAQRAVIDPDLKEIYVWVSSLLHASYSLISSLASLGLPVEMERNLGSPLYKEK